MTNVHQLAAASRLLPERTWTLRIDLYHEDGGTRAAAHLDVGDHGPITVTGIAYSGPDAAATPAVADELAVAIALSKLSHFLVEAAASDVDGHRRDSGSLDR